jgi:hypothetical protein
MEKIDFNTTGNMITLSLSLENMPDWAAANLFSYLLTRAISIAPELERVVYGDEIIQRVFDTLDAGKPQDE